MSVHLVPEAESFGAFRECCVEILANCIPFINRNAAVAAEFYSPFTLKLLAPSWEYLIVSSYHPINAKYWTGQSFGQNLNAASRRSRCHYNSGDVNGDQRNDS
jgi:hypothetical protein